MAGFIYFLPGGDNRNGLTPVDAHLLGLGYAFEARLTARGVPGVGPAGGSGACLADPARVKPAQIGYWPDRQTWREIPASEAGAWLGFYSADPPTPADLARADQLTGHWVELGDGRKWLAPAARKFAEVEGEIRAHCGLPQASDLDDDGRWTVGPVIEGRRQLWELACAFWDALSGSESSDAGITFDFAGDRDAAVAALAANYLVDRVECAALGLLTQPAIESVLLALVDWPTLAAWLKKKAATPPAGDSASSNGPAASTPDTGPQSPICGPWPAATPTEKTRTCISTNGGGGD